MSRKATKRDLVELLKRVEYQLTHTPQFNPWDTGPSALLIDVRQALGIPVYQLGEKRPPLSRERKKEACRSAQRFIEDLRRYVGSADSVRVVMRHEFRPNASAKHWCSICNKTEGDPIHVSLARKD